MKAFSFLLRQVVVSANAGRKKVIIYWVIDLVIVYRWIYSDFSSIFNSFLQRSIKGSTHFVNIQIMHWFNLSKIYVHLLYISLSYLSHKEVSKDILFGKIIWFNFSPLTLSGPRFSRYRKDRGGVECDFHPTPPSILFKIGR